MTFWQVTNDEGSVIAQYKQDSQPKSPKNYSGAWDVKEVPKDELINDVKWWFEA